MARAGSVSAQTGAPSRARTPGDRRQRSEKTREHLLDVAVECLAELGYSGASTHVIARRAGISRGAHLYHFPTKADLLVAALEHIFSKRRAELDERSSDIAASETERLSATVDLLWSLFDGPLFYASLELLNASRTDDELAARLRPASASMVEQLHGICRRVLRMPPAVADGIANMTIDLMYGMAVGRVLHDDENVLRAYLEVWKWVVGLSVEALAQGRRPVVPTFGLR